MAADRLASEGIDVEVIDPRTLVPLDFQTLMASVEKTRRVVVVDECHQSCGVAAELEASGFAPVFVKHGPILENVVESNIDLESFPAPIWHTEDGGRFIGTGSEGYLCLERKEF